MVDFDKGKRWRARAEALRGIADGASDAVARRSLLRLAGEWERMADRCEQAERLRQPPPPAAPPRPHRPKKAHPQE
ncbi:MAG: hypothetical protein FJX64_08355 [Alphaproteobacteria bacterium]|nr:hypothetical protein [Alphaproteobacteria bacterium]